MFVIVALGFLCFGERIVCLLVTSLQDWCFPGYDIDFETVFVLLWMSRPTALNMCAISFVTVVLYLLVVFEDGRLCAAAFVQNRRSYTGCTDAPNPVGGSGRAWCYVEAQVLSFHGIA